MFVSLALRCKDDLAGPLIFPVGMSLRVEGLDQKRLRVRKIIALDFELGFAGGKLLDNFFNGYRGRPERPWSALGGGIRWLCLWFARKLNGARLRACDRLLRRCRENCP